MAWSQTNFERLPEEEHSILFVCVPKVHLQKQQDEDYEQEADQRKPTHVQLATYSGNTQGKEETVPATLQRWIEQSLKYEGGYCSVEIHCLASFVGKEQLGALELH